jgi:hypothetical protein
MLMKIQVLKINPKRSLKLFLKQNKQIPDKPKDQDHLHPLRKLLHNL